MNDLDNSQLNLMKVELEAYKNQLEIQRNNFAEELKNGVGEEIKKHISQPPTKVSKLKLFINKLFRICK